MKIEHVEAVRFEGSLWGAFWDIQKSAPCVGPLSHYPEYATALEGWWWPQAQVLVRIVSDTGVTGIGWAEDGTGGATLIIERHLSRLLMHKDPLRSEVLWDQMYRASIPYGRGGVLMHALSAVDIALWDLRGKAAGLPVHALLGGARQLSLKAYASHLQPVPVEDLVAEAQGYVADGYTAMKMRMPGGPAHGRAGLRRNEALIGAVRTAIGDDIDLMLDAYMGWDLRFAVQMAGIAAALGVGWMEEPLLPDEHHAYRVLCDKSQVAIAHGENVFTPWDFHRLMEDGAMQLAQPDVHRCGGITGFKRIAMIAESFGIEVAPHAFSSPTVHVCSTLTNCRMLEKLTIPCWAESRYPDVPPLFLGEPAVENGSVRIPDQPGLGVKLNTDVVPHLASWH